MISKTSGKRLSCLLFLHVLSLLVTSLKIVVTNQFKTFSCANPAYPYFNQFTKGFGMDLFKTVSQALKQGFVTHNKNEKNTLAKFSHSPSSTSTSAFSLTLVFSLLLALHFTSSSANAQNSAPAEKDWTVLVFLNGNNDLDPYGTKDINEMEEAGSTDRVNVVVQWASIKKPDTKRLYITKDKTNAITSPVVETLQNVDMGNAQTLTEFIKWGITHYPAKHYLVDIWNHGGGWHYVNNIKVKSNFANNDMIINNISYDDKTGHSISTAELGQSMREVTAMLGRKIDILGTDACLMAMIEVLSEVQDSVQYFAGSEEVIPGNGWEYKSFLTKVYEASNANPNEALAPIEVGHILADTYYKSYNLSPKWNTEVTFSIVDLEKISGLWGAMKDLGAALQTQPTETLNDVKKISVDTQAFTRLDYLDLGDFMNRLRQNPKMKDLVPFIDNVLAQMNEMVKYNYVTKNYENSHGIAFWFPESGKTLSKYFDAFQSLVYNQNTNWIRALTQIYPTNKLYSQAQ